MNIAKMVSKESKQALPRLLVHLGLNYEHQPNSLPAQRVKACLRCRFLEKPVGILTLEKVMPALNFFSAIADTLAVDVNYLTHALGKCIVRD